MHVGHWRFACEPHPAASHVLFANDADIFIPAGRSNWVFDKKPTLERNQNFVTNTLQQTMFCIFEFQISMRKIILITTWFGCRYIHRSPSAETRVHFDSGNVKSDIVISCPPLISCTVRYQCTWIIYDYEYDLIIYYGVRDC